MHIQNLYNIFKAHPTVTTDSRDCPVGSLFFALKGDNFDGNRFAAAALDKGCAYAVVDEEQYAVAGDDRYIVVDDVLQTLKQLANHHRRTLATPVIGITGTNGKTTTKELVAVVLAKRYNVLYTEGNFNNEIGVPKTLLRLTAEHEIAVIEMGASHPGDIKSLVDVVEPDFGLITNVGRAHLQGFGSFEGVVRTKGELYDFLRKKSEQATSEKPVVFIHGENEYLMNIAGGLHLVKYGSNDDDSLYVSGQTLRNTPFLNFRWRHFAGQWHEVCSHVIGSYNLYNMLAAATVGLFFGVAERQICEALAAYTPSNSRSQLVSTARNQLIVDAYNANPTSMMAALDNFASVEAVDDEDITWRKMAILGDMRELGDVSHDEHQKIVDYLEQTDIEAWLVGSEFGQTRTSLRTFSGIDEVKQALRTERPEGYYILIKGSNSMKLYELPGLL